MDFVTHLPRTPWRHDAVWVIVDRLTKSAHFLAMRMTVTLEEFYRLYVREIVRLHGVSVSIVSDRDRRFTTHFWKSFPKGHGGTVAYRWNYRRVYQVSMRCSTSPCSGSILQIQLMWWIGERLLLILMRSLRRDQCVSW